MELKIYDHTLNMFEKEVIAMEICELYGKKEELENEIKQLRATFKTKIDGLEEKITKLAAAYRKGKERREVNADFRLDPKTKERVWFCVDTDEEILREPYREEDYQQKLFSLHDQYDDEENESQQPGDVDTAVASIGVAMEILGIEDKKEESPAEDTPKGERE
ncbi:MAG: hypothetical protein KAW12_07100 [Candidatus Aminicenantes bacterium]|nr:hypothetical protein [Candidatus Aminicenantes bacterium]